jgi:assimilatory nitrate reductase catalytic subunit
VRHATIVDAVTNGHHDVDAVGALLKAGTNCGSCRAEIKRIIADVRADADQPAAA